MENHVLFCEADCLLTHHQLIPKDARISVLQVRRRLDNEVEQEQEQEQEEEEEEEEQGEAGEEYD